MKPLSILALAIGLSACAPADQVFRSRVQSATVNAGVTHSGDVGLSTTVVFRDPQKGGLAK